MSEKTASKGYTEQELEQMDSQELLQLYKETGDQSLKWPLALRYSWLVKNVANKVRGIYNNFAQVDDIVNEGFITLFSVIDQYDPTKGMKFETYATMRLRGMIIDLVREYDWMPRSMRKRAKEIETAVSDLSKEFGRSPTDHEIAEHLGITDERYNKYMADIALGKVVSLEGLINMCEKATYRFEIPCNDLTRQPEMALQEKELQAFLAQSISELRQNEQIVISLHYEKELTQREIARVLEVTPARVSQIHAQAMEKLYEKLRSYIDMNQSEPLKKKRRDAKCSKVSTT